MLAGGATGMIGDPREAGERSLTTPTQCRWTERIRGQLERFVDFDAAPTGAIVENNLSWTAGLSAIEFLRDIGKHFSVNVMLDRDTVRRRLDGEGISYTEFSYMLLQANDYVNCTGATAADCRSAARTSGATSSPGCGWSARSSARRVHALTVPLVTAADGTKFGKIHRRRQPLAGPGDDEPLRLVPVLRQHRGRRRDPATCGGSLSCRPRNWRSWKQATAERPHQRAAQRRLARELDPLVHGEAATASVEHASQALFGQGELRGSTNRRWPRRCAKRRWPS